MKRLIDFDLAAWRISSHRKPLLMRGARQVGKTHAVRKLGKNFSNFVEINFEKQPDYKTVFEKDLDPVRIINTLATMTNKFIAPEKTLLFFDEIQACPNAITALRYFYEEMPGLHVIGAGSLLDFAIEQIGVPVGRIEYCYVYPLSFMEYLASLGNKLLFEKLLSHEVDKPLDDILHDKLFDFLGQYMLLGGMPAVIADSLEQKNFNNTARLQHAIIDAYRDDFPKYSKKLQIKYVDALFNHIPHCLGQAFKFSHIPGGYQKRELNPALDLLAKAGVVHKVYQTAANGIPLSAEANFEKIKLIFLDIALNQAMLGTNLSEWLLNPMEAFINKGALTEALVGQELLAYSCDYIKTELYYWQRDKSGSQAEVDYIMQLREKIIPIEVKSGKGTTLRSLHVFLESRPKSPFGIRFSVRQYGIEEKLHSYPLYAIGPCMAHYDSDLKKRLQFLLNSALE